MYHFADRNLQKETGVVSIQNGKTIRDLREDYDLTQEQLGAIANCSAKQISRYESEGQEMTVGRLQAICQHFQISADYFLGLPKNLRWPR